MNPQELYKAYVQISHTALNEEQFYTLLSFFPSLLVVAADGIIDEEEQVYISYIAKSMAENFLEDHQNISDVDTLKNLFLKDLEKLAQSIPVWEEKFLDALKIYLKKHPEIKNDIIETMYLFSDASESSADLEEALIEKLKMRLELE